MSEYKNIVFNLYDFTYDNEIIEVNSCDGVYVKCDGQNAEVGGGTVPQLMRAYTLFVKNIKEGKTNFEICEKPHFDACAVMIDASRNAVMRVGKIKEFLNYMASLGMNRLMLYMEDTYDVPGYPRMGYMRGKYTITELKEIDDYAFSLGIEVVPCIQTLAHLNHFLQWNESSQIADTLHILLAGDDKTYEFIETCIKTIRSAFRTNKIHIGFDEAVGLGTGQYFNKNGYRDSLEILNDHLNRIVDICKKFGFKPIIWGDMYLRARSKSRHNYDTEYASADEIKALIPDVELVYWDYYHTDENTYSKLFNEYIVMDRPISFAGGIWSWCGQLTSPQYTMDTTVPGLKAALKLGIKSVAATMWGDDGNECDLFQCVPLISFYSEFCYKGLECTEDDIKNMVEFVAGCSWDVINASSKFSEFVPEGEKRNYTGKNILYGNLFMHLLNTERPISNTKKDLREGYEIYKNDSTYKYTEFAKLLFKIAIAKLDIIDGLRDNYKNKEYTLELINNILPEIKEDVKKLSDMHMKQWLETYKPFGYEILNGRYGWVIADIDYTIYRLKEFVEGRCDCIEELEVVPVPGNRMGRNRFYTAISPNLMG